MKQTSVSQIAWLLVVMLGVLPGIAHAQSESRIHMHGKGLYATDGLLYVPMGEGPFAAVLLLPDEQGITRRIKDVAASLVQAGYLAVVVDLNRGLTADASKPSDEQIQLDLDAAMTFLGMQSNVRQAAIGAIGWGSGGIDLLEFAPDGKLDAIVLEHTPVGLESLKLHAITAPVLWIVPAHDVPAASRLIKAAERHLRSQASSVTVKTYWGASAGFDDPDDAVHYAPRDSSDARRATLDFFAASLVRH